MKTIVPLMTELGFSAIRNGSMTEAENIFISLADLAQDDAAAFIGLATVKLSFGDVDTAINYLESGLEKTTTNAHEARKLLLIAYMLKGNDEGAEALHRQFITDNEHAANDEYLERAESFFNQ